MKKNNKKIGLVLTITTILLLVGTLSGCTTNIQSGNCCPEEYPEFELVTEYSNETDYEYNTTIKMRGLKYGDKSEWTNNHRVKIITDNFDIIIASCEKTNLLIKLSYFLNENVTLFFSVKEYDVKENYKYVMVGDCICYVSANISYHRKYMDLIDAKVI